MHVIRRRGWEIPEHHATPEHLFLDRRAFLAAGGAAAISLSPSLAMAQRAADVPDPTADLYPVKRNEKFVLDRPVTEEKINTNYNNFYEFGTSKQIARNAQALKLRPWTVKVDGMVEKAQEIGAKSEGSTDASTPEILGEMAELAATGKIEVPIAATYPLDEVREAFEQLEDRHTLGKIVLLP